MGHSPTWLVGVIGTGKSALRLRFAQCPRRHFADAKAKIVRAAVHSIDEISSREDEAFLGRDDVVYLAGTPIAQPGSIVYRLMAPETVDESSRWLYAAGLWERTNEIEERP